MAVTRYEKSLYFERWDQKVRGSGRQGTKKKDASTLQRNRPRANRSHDPEGFRDNS